MAVPSQNQRCPLFRSKAVISTLEGLAKTDAGRFATIVLSGHGDTDHAPSMGWFAPGSYFGIPFWNLGKATFTQARVVSLLASLLKPDGVVVINSCAVDRKEHLSLEQSKLWNARMHVFADALAQQRQVWATQGSCEYSLLPSARGSDWVKVKANSN
jgi:hypothetical protein